MTRIAVLVPLLLAAISGLGQDSLTPPGSLNKPERLEWFRDIGFGLFIHWSVDSQTGVVISHSLAGADEAYTKRFYNELPKTFNPRKFEPRTGPRWRSWPASSMSCSHQAPFGLRHVGHKDDRLRHHAHATSSGH